MIDRDGKQCESCGKGTYEIADLNDEIHGERHCNKCGHFVYRYEKTEDTLTTGTGTLTGQSRCPIITR